MFIGLPTGHPICRWIYFFSRTQTNIFNLNPLQSASHIMAVNGTHKFFSLREKITNINRQNQIKPCGSWWYIEVPAVVNALRTVGHCGGPGVKKYIYKYCTVSCTDRSFCVFTPQCIVTSRQCSILFWLCMFFLTLKAMTAIIWLTDCNGLS